MNNYGQEMVGADYGKITSDDDYRIIGFTIRGKEQTWYSFHEFYKYKKESE